PPPAPGMAPTASAAPAPSAPADPANPSITNVQIAGVDEGGIVKVIGDHLVVLRRGRLFTVSTAAGDLKAIDSIDAFPPGVDPSGDWYDEMLVRGDLIVVVGFSYDRGGTEINRFRMAPDGSLAFLDSHHLKSNDYYSSRNYASRIVGDRLVVYTPLYFARYEADPLADMPGLSRWTPGREKPSFQRIAQATEVYMPAPLRAEGPGTVEAMHTVSRCDLTAAELSCEATVVLGPNGRTFFVSRNAVYVWVAPAWSWSEDGDDRRFLYRIPLDGGRPAAVEVEGAPVDQFSFNPDAANNRLDILVASLTGGDAMWGPEFAAGSPALLQLPTSRFGDGSQAAPASDYRPMPGGEYVGIGHNRFVNGWLLYSLNNWTRNSGVSHLIAARLDGAGHPFTFQVDGGVQRIEQLGQDALLVGGHGETVFTTVDLTSNSIPYLGFGFTVPDSRQAESRSHGFFFRPDPDPARSTFGLLGLPIMRLADNQWTAEMRFLQRQNRILSDFGHLDATPGPRVDDGCQASCVDWYGNARPIFLGDRVFALMGYELVEGDATGAAIRERRRVDFTPVAAPGK
ncbi:MAG: beta-propeller domain-containing protein, partial [Brevundimonas sp.]|uniref:beta-propeller domain-containing protein n=2 Tax=Brevundimonas sp. TaxID=1871086 RepID=UPI002613181D